MVVLRRVSNAAGSKSPATATTMLPERTSEPTKALESAAVIASTEALVENRFIQ